MEENDDIAVVHTWDFLFGRRGRWGEGEVEEGGGGDVGCLGSSPRK